MYWKTKQKQTAPLHRKAEEHCAEDMARSWGREVGSVMITLKFRKSTVVSKDLGQKKKRPRVLRNIINLL